MAAVVWGQNLCVGIQQIDDEHQNLVAILNQLDAAMKNGKGNRVMTEILSKLLQYTQMHFEAEEKFMVECAYPKTQLHQAQHRQLVEKLVKFQVKFEKNGYRITSDMMDFLTYWLTNHILGDDKTFAQFFNAAKSKS